MTLADILEQQRALYLDEFVRRLRGYPADMSKLLLPEALYCDEDGAPVRTGKLKLPARGDICVRQNNRVAELALIESPRRLGFEPFQFVWNSALKVALHPFAWDDCRLCIPEPKIALNDRVLVDWFEDAIRLDKGSGAGDALIGVTHGMTAPREAADGVRFEIDLGSAPVAIFETLLTAIADAGAGMVSVGQVSPVVSETPG